MKTYKIPFLIQSSGFHTVDADSLEQAVEKSYDMPLSAMENVEYLGDTYEVDYDGLEDHEEFKTLTVETKKLNANDKSSIIQAWNELEEISQDFEDIECFKNNLNVVQQRVERAMYLLGELFTEDEAQKELRL